MAFFTARFQPPTDNPLWPALVIKAQGEGGSFAFQDTLKEVKALEVERFWSEEYEEEWVAGEDDPFTVALTAAGYTAIEITEIPTTIVVHSDELVA